MTVGSSQQSVGSGAPTLLASVPQTAAPGPAASVFISNGSGAVVYLGGSNVSSTNGAAMAVSTQITLTLFPGDALYAITASGSSTVSVVQT